ncbi:MAG: hypothetical protein KF777_16910 [Planctomycetaceae bacterium]|nr:hypothetical protein [Planctomycetaceae bacterium]
MCWSVRSVLSLSAVLLVPTFAVGQSPSSGGFPQYRDPNPRRYDLTARASEIDPRAKPHPEINFVFEKDGKPADVEHAVVDTSVRPRGRLVIWLMGHNQALFERLSGYGLHAIQVHYANGWFSTLNKEPPPDDQYLGRIRLEAATGEDHSDAIDIPQPDGMTERSLQFVKWLAKEHPVGHWDEFINESGDSLRWDRVIVAGISHGSTTAARFALHQRVDRVVMLSGPRDQLERWYTLPSATPKNRFFGFTHVLDTGWIGDHYCRSWELLGLNEFGPVVNVDRVRPPFGNSRRLVTDADVKEDKNRAHSAAQPGGAAVKNAKGEFVHEAVWKYLFTHATDKVGKAVPLDADCEKDLSSRAK